MPILCCIVMFMMMSCATAPTTVTPDYPAPQSKEACMQLFVDVLAIQKKRSDAADEMHRITSSFNTGKMSVRKYRAHHYDWLAVEETLRKRVTHIYDVGYKHGCFERCMRNTPTTHGCFDRSQRDNN